MKSKFQRLATRLSLLLPLLGLLLATSGCGWLMHGVAGGERTVQVEAQYRGLANRRIAVMAAAPDPTLYLYPHAQREVSRAVTARILQHIPGTSAVSPTEIATYQRNNPWLAVPAGQLMEHLDVERLVLIDLAEYRTHEPGNRHVWQGLVAGSVSVFEAEAEDSDQPRYVQDTVRVEFPEGKRMVVDSNSQDIEVGMLTLFGREVAWLFYDHEETQ